ncbi:putative non-specific lipid-transfer protein 14 [Alnus glutinosa]|uniref:putative non-specific lipid-transfer protein 14 n=1 Tax=Alnus glutinosa TaxID=3517 RepID=UPI002D76B381|nr:putative non-specific lipid-transfer protein 14 [Alnus glutinosa]
MVKQKASTSIIGVLIISLATILACASAAATAIECSTVTTLVSTCSSFISDGSPDPLPGTPCCDAMVSVNAIGDHRFVCRCMMGLITTNSPNATAIATLPGFCGVSLGFTIDPNTDCSL